MTTQVQKRRGTTSEHSTFTGAEGEITVDTTKDTAVVHDGVSAGGKPLAREDLNNVSASTVAAKLNGTAITGVDINSGSIDSTTIGATTPAAGTFTTLNATGLFQLDTISELTTDAGVTIETVLIKDGQVDGRDVSADGTKLDGIESGADATDTANVTAAGALMDSELTNITAVKALNQGVSTTDSPTFAGLTTTANINFGDNDKAIFGAGSDLQIFHTGSYSAIRDVGTGGLFIGGENYVDIGNAGASETYARFHKDAQVDLYHNNAIKLATTSTGIDVTGTVTADGLTVDGEANIGSSGTQVRIDSSASASLIEMNGSSYDYIRSTGASSSLYLQTNGSTSRQRIHSNGDISFYEDTGTTAKFFWDASAESLRSPVFLTGNSQNSYVSDGYAAIYSTGTGGSAPFNEAGHLILQARSSGALRDILFATGNGAEERMRIDSSGNVGIGSTLSGGLPDKVVIKTSGQGVIKDALMLTTGQSDNYAGTGVRINMAGVSEANSDVRHSYIESATTTTNNDHYLAFGTNSVGADATERMRIDSSGNVGIGTSSPASVSGFSKYLEIESSTSAALNATYDNGGGSTCKVEIGASSGGGWIGTGTGSLTDVRFVTGGSERMRIDSSGNLLVGKTSSGTGNAGFQVVNNVTGVTGASNWALIVNRTGTDGQSVLFQNDTVSCGSISVSGSSTAYNTSSDYRLKEDWQPVANASDRVAQLKPVNFAWKADGTRVDGFLAHELQEVIPEAVTGEKDAMRTEEYVVTEAIPATYDEEGNELTPAVDAVMGTREVPDYQGIDQSKLVPLLTAALQEALTEIDNLKQRVSALENS